MRITSASLPEALQTLSREFNSDPTVSETWKRYRNQSIDVASLQNFFRSHSGKGLIEHPQKLPSHHLPSYIHGSTRVSRFPFFSFRNGSLQFVFDRWFKREEAAIQFRIFQSMGIRFPLWEPQYGDFYFDFNGQSYNTNMGKYARNYSYLTRHIDSLAALDTVCEIGGGYGGFCEFMLLNLPRVTAYVIIDLPETLAVSMTYLSTRLGPDHALVLPKTPDDLQKPVGAAKTIFFIPANTLSRFDSALSKQIPVKLFFNSDSFIEMSRAALQAYFDFMQYFSDCFLFSSNAATRRETDTTGAFTASTAQFPRDDRWTTVFSQPEFERDTLVQILKR